MTAPAAFALTMPASPDRHARAAALLGGPARPEALPEALRGLIREVGLPNGLAELGYGTDDVDDQVEGALKQQRLLATAPVDVTAEDLAGVFRASLEHW